MRTPLLPLGEIVKLPREKRMTMAKFKKLHGIVTHDIQDPTDPGRWMACLLDECKRRFACYGVEKDDDLFTVMSKVCRLADESGLIVQHSSELLAVRELCKENKIDCPL